MKLPPPEKIYEAWSALVSGRLTSQSDPESSTGESAVISSSGQKTYFVHWHDNIYYSTDPATWWQGYPGYPVLAVLMYRRLLPYDPALAQLFDQVPWETINRQAGRDYALALTKVMNGLAVPETEKNKIRIFAEETFNQLAGLNIELRRFVKAKNANGKS